jgi:hypothetical protein
MSAVFINSGVRFGDPPAVNPPEPDDPNLTPRQNFKNRLARAYLNTNQPQNFSRLPVQNPVEQVVMPAAQAWNKGAGDPVTPEEIEERRAAARREFAERQSKAWQSRVYHM